MSVELGWVSLGVEHLRQTPTPAPEPYVPKRPTIERDSPPTGEPCMNGCERLDTAAGRLEPVRTHPPYVVCDACVERVLGFVDTIGQHYPRLDGFILPGSAEVDPDTPAGPRDDHSVVPLRVAVVDLTDSRHLRVVEVDEDGRHRHMDPARPPLANVRGVTGVVQRWAQQMRVERNSAGPDRPTLDTELGYVEDHLDYALSRPWAPSMFHDLRKVQSRVLDAVGIQRRRPIAFCDTLLDDPDTDEPPYTCGGPMFALRDTFGVVCTRCHRRYGVDELTPGARRPLVTRRLTPKEKTA
ncbi:MULTISPECIES: hypothetical protein [unclassified Aeromicrobium]|uniref:hypothetical protein n=1 Tax=unclassified Aeromicrobium TaxID=2633570 RepID=UPI00288A3110|nr:MULTISPECIES: hypothetical protein [unclassified Aeromicrobium]